LNPDSNPSQKVLQDVLKLEDLWAAARMSILERSDNVVGDGAGAGDEDGDGDEYEDDEDGFFEE
jgi:hypothetical protein